MDPYASCKENLSRAVADVAIHRLYSFQPCSLQSYCISICCFTFEHEVEAHRITGTSRRSMALLAMSQLRLMLLFMLVEHRLYIFTRKVSGLL
jgi:hypothetical protein